MDDTAYLYPAPRGRWAISRRVNTRWVTLIQDSCLCDEMDAVEVLRALGIPPIESYLEAYFPLRNGSGRCPTLALMELCNVLDPTNPHSKNGREVGV